MSAAPKLSAVNAIPTLDAIANAPDCLIGLPFETLTALRAKAAATLAVIESAQLVAINRSERENTEADEWLKVNEAAAMLRVQPRWIWRNKRKLGFVRQTGPRSLLCSKRGIENWLASRKAR
jgi:hypothetical protein